MSRGFGTMQRDILRAFETPTPLFPEGVKGYNWLRVQVAKQRGLWCETDCRTTRDPFKSLRKPHTPHLDFVAQCSGFAQSFARALRQLVRRGVLVAIDYDGLPGVYRSERIATVRRPKF